MIEESLEDTLGFSCQLISRPSVTPDDKGCQRLIAERLEFIGFKSHHLRFEDVDNLWTSHGSGAPLFVFAGHTDVVPPGDEQEWSTDPFEPTFKGDYLFGRGSADMKSGLAAMIVGLEDFLGGRIRVMESRGALRRRAREG